MDIIINNEEEREDGKIQQFPLNKLLCEITQQEQKRYNNNII